MALPNHLKFTIRLFRRDKFYASLNILGLSIGLCIGILLLLVLQHDLTYDIHYTSHQRIYRLGSHYQIKGVDEWVGSVARELGPVIREQYPELEDVLPVQSIRRTIVHTQKTGETDHFKEDQIIRTNSRYFHVFSHLFISGDPRTCLANPNAVVLTRSVARKYFGQADPLDQSLLIDGSVWKVTAVIEDVRENSHLKFSLILSGLPDYRTWTVTDNGPSSEAFWNPDIYLYTKAPEGYSVEGFYQKWPAIYNQYFKEIGDQMAGSNTPVLQRLAEIHLDTRIQDGEAHGSVAMLYTLAGIGILIILLACINYMNLSTARAIQRSNEIMIRKSLGSTRSQVIFSLVTESVFMSFLAWVFALIMVVTLISLPAFTEWTGRNLSMDLFASWEVILGSFLLPLLIGLFSGLYPAFYCTRIPISGALKGNQRSRQGILVRKTFLVVQFSISVFVVICTVYMRHQLEFVQSRDLGFSKENLLVLPIPDSVVFKKLGVIKASLAQSQNIESVTASQDIPGLGVGSGVVFGESNSGMKEEGGVLCLFVGDDYLKTMGIQLIEGRDFRSGDIDINGKYLANESAVKLMGWSAPIGRKVQLWGGANPGEVIGVVKDFNFNSLYQGIDPMVIIKGHWRTGYLQVRLRHAGHAQAIREIGQTWSELFPDHFFEYFFLDQRFNAQYKDDLIQQRLSSVLAVICIIISLLGIVGLSAFSTAQRTKEIGIRKVMGARTGHIILLLSKDSIILLIAAVTIVIPASFWAIAEWLQHFAYRMEADWLPCLVVVVASIALVLSTIAAQCYHVASMNPVNALKHE
ncbi:MAG TPA: ABC transporter permease [Cyclobacteriaceae bacterium]|nr:ABC transporter permease [Cyclobacteriaceae bacterium]